MNRFRILHICVAMHLRIDYLSHPYSTYFKYASLPYSQCKTTPWCFVSGVSLSTLARLTLLHTHTHTHRERNHSPRLSLPPSSLRKAPLGEEGTDDPQTLIGFGYPLSAERDCSLKRQYLQTAKETMVITLYWLSNIQKIWLMVCVKKINKTCVNSLVKWSQLHCV